MRSGTKVKYSHSRCSATVTPCCVPTQCHHIRCNTTIPNDGQQLLGAAIIHHKYFWYLAFQPALRLRCAKCRSARTASSSHSKVKFKRGRENKSSVVFRVILCLTFKVEKYLHAGKITYFINNIGRA